MKRWLATIAMIALVHTTTPLDSAAETIVVHFTAQVTRVWDPWGWIDTVKVGDLMYGTYVYETGAPDQNPSPREGWYQYQAPPAYMSINLLSHAFRSDPDSIDFNIVVRDSAGGDPIDGYHAYEYNVVDMNRPYMWVYAMGISLEDSTGLALSSDALPSEPPNLADWPHVRKVLILADWEIQARIISISGGEIPLLSTRMMIVVVLLLLVSGIFWLRRTRLSSSHTRSK